MQNAPQLRGVLSTNLKISTVYAAVRICSS